MILTQIVIATCGVAAVWLSQDARESRRRYASVFGLCAQPAWIVETYTHQQWIVLGLTLLYGWGWARGFWKYWILPRRAAA